MTFLHPWAIWVGIAAAAVPVVVHLLTRPRPVRMPLSTLRFVREAIRQRRARHRLRDALVLALRTLAILLLALAVARPHWGDRPLVSDGQAGDAVRVVVLDTSQSMGATDGGIAGLERARTIAARYLRYQPGLQANLVLAGASPRGVFEEPSTNFDALRDELARCRVLPQRLDVNRALELAARCLAPGSEDDQRRRELVVISDFQRANWSRADFAQLPESTQIQLESTAPAEPPANLAVLGVNARTRTSRGRAMQLEVEVGNFGPTARKAAVEVAIGPSTWRLEATCPPKRRTTLSEEVEFRGLGWQSGRATLVGVDDALADDDTRPLVVQVRPKPVYVLLTRQSADRRPSSSHFLECSLVPDAVRGNRDKASADVRRIDPAQVDRTALAPADMIFLDHPGKLSDEAITLLAGLLRRGRPIVYVAGEMIDATNLKRLADAAGSGLQMPVEFIPPPADRRRQNLFLTSVAQENPTFGVFGDQLTAVTGQLRFAGGLGSRRLDTGLEADILATYSDGSACIVLTASDAGSLAVINADLAASNLAKSKAFVPMIEELVGQMLDGNGRQRSSFCGEPLVAQLPADAGPTAGLAVVAPTAGDQPDDGGCGELVDEGAGVVWQWPSPTRPGVYEVRRDDATVFAAAVTVPPEESELDSLSPEVLTGRLAAGRATYYRSITGQGDRRDDAWKWFALACVVCILGELTALLAFRT